MNEQARTGSSARAALVAGAAVLALLGVLFGLDGLESRPPSVVASETSDPSTMDEETRASLELASPSELDGGRALAAQGAPSALAKPAVAVAQPEKEKEHYARFRALLAADPAALERAAPGLLLGGASVPERVGLLRALEDGGSAQTTRLYELALFSEPAATKSGPVQEFALRSLARLAPKDAHARAALRDAIWGARASADGVLRRRAAGHLAATASDAELAAGFPELATEPDPLVVQAFQGALAERASGSLDFGPSTP